jgi:TATA-box binding protein (TBP) (component of TFIID and TFIIIB)
MGRAIKNENMPGVMFRIDPVKDYVKSVIIFKSGIVNLMGGTQMINLERAQAYLMKELPPFRLKPLPNNEPY